MNEIILKKGIPGDIDGIFVLVQEFAASYGPEKDKFINSFTNALNDEAPQPSGRGAFFCSRNQKQEKRNEAI